jgi:23S rRNA (uracil1939-C5)-methyltransferase
MWNIWWRRGMTESADAICRHFGTCGGCTYQDMQPDDYGSFKRQIVLDALAREGLGDTVVDEVVQIRPATRRRATFKSEKHDGTTLFGFHAAASHTIVNMLECRVLTPELARLVPFLREMTGERLKNGAKAELYVVQADNGFDVALHGVPADAASTTWAARWMERLRLSRVTAGGQIIAELGAPTVAIGRANVHLPPLAFLQPTRDGETVLQQFVLAAVGQAKYVADLFAGVGTFALRLAEGARVHAVDADGAALDALEAAARMARKLKPISVLSRDLFRRPLGAGELNAFDAVVLDPPRAGAVQQARELAGSKVEHIAYVSCNPASFARDARLLAAGGYRLGSVTPVDQFIWSSHIELVARFSRG